MKRRKVLFMKKFLPIKLIFEMSFFFIILIYYSEKKKGKIMIKNFANVLFRKKCALKYFN